MRMAFKPEMQLDLIENVVVDQEVQISYEKSNVQLTGASVHNNKKERRVFPDIVSEDTVYCPSL